MTATVEIITDRKANVLSIPLGAVTTRTAEEQNESSGDNSENMDEEDSQMANNDNKKEEEDEVVFVNVNGIAKLVKVKTGISDYDNIEILEGISDTTEVVTGPFLVVSKRLKNGDAIKKDEKNEKGKEEK